MKNERFIPAEMLSLLAIAGNILFALWILYNGINESFKGTIIEIISYGSLMVLLTVNAFLLICHRKQQSKND